MNDLPTSVKEYVASLASERGLAGNTITAYRRDLAQYLAFLDDRRPGPELISRYVAALRDRGLAPSTIARKVASIRGLHRFLVAEGVTDDDPTVLLVNPKKPDALPKALSYEEVERLLLSPNTSKRLGRRDRALLEFLYATGARVAEVVALDILDVDFDGSTALITGKGRKQRIVPVGSHALAAVRDYLPNRMTLRRGRPDPGALFLNARGQRLTRQGLWAIVRRHSDRAGFARDRVSPHVLRHSAATHMVEGGADLRTVQELLGHASISTTQVYTRISPRHLYEVYVECHPRSR